MSVLDTAKVRSSVRAYTEQAVEEEKLPGSGCGMCR